MAGAELENRRIYKPHLQPFCPNFLFPLILQEEEEGEEKLHQTRGKEENSKMSELATSLEKAMLVPGSAAALIPTSFAPTADLSVSFGADAAVHLGNMLRVSQVQQKPTIGFQLLVHGHVLRPHLDFINHV